METRVLMFYTLVYWFVRVFIINSLQNNECYTTIYIVWHTIEPPSQYFVTGDNTIFLFNLPSLFLL